MIINLRELAAKGNTVHLHGQMDVTDMIKRSKEIISAEPLLYDLNAKHSVHAVNVTGQLFADMELVCSRCLCYYDEKLQIAFHEAFSYKNSASKQEGTVEDENIHYVSEDKVDLAPYLEENVLLELPYIPLCDLACKGLCPVCGTNRNERLCGCKQENIDPRLAGLEKFFEE